MERTIVCFPMFQSYLWIFIMTGITKVFSYSVLTYLVIASETVTCFPSDVSQNTISSENITKANNLLENSTIKTDLVTNESVLVTNESSLVDNSTLNGINNDNIAVSGTNLDEKATISTARDDFIGNSRIKCITARCFIGSITDRNIERENVNDKSENNTTDSSVENSSSVDNSTVNTINNDKTTVSDTDLDESATNDNFMGIFRIKGLTARCFIGGVTNRNVERVNNAPVNNNSENNTTKNVTTDSSVENLSSVDNSTVNGINNDKTTVRGTNLDENAKNEHFIGIFRIKGLNARCFIGSVTDGNIERENYALVNYKSENNTTENITDSSVENSSSDETTKNGVTENYANLVLNEAITQSEVETYITENSSTAKISTEENVTENITTEDYTTLSSTDSGSTDEGYTTQDKVTEVYTDINSTRDDLMNMVTMKDIKTIKSSIIAVDLNVKRLEKMNKFENVVDDKGGAVTSGAENNNPEIVVNSDDSKEYAITNHDITEVEESENNRLYRSGYNMLDHTSDINASINSSSLTNTSGIKGGKGNSTAIYAFDKNIPDGMDEIQNRSVAHPTFKNQLTPVNSMRIDERMQPQVQHHTFDYEISDGAGTIIFRRESVDGRGFMKGSYGYRDNQGLYREVEYEADVNGFRAIVRTNEPGAASANPANVDMVAEPPPMSILESWQRRRETLNTGSVHSFG